jgi:hypothetical protein
MVKMSIFAQKANTPFKDVLRQYIPPRIDLVYESILYRRTGRMKMTRLEGYYKYYYLYKQPYVCRLCSVIFK